MGWTRLGFALAVGAGCAAPADRPPPKGGADTAADTGPAPDTGGPPRAPDWSAVEATLDAAWADAPPEIPGLGLLIVDAAGATLFAGTRGALDLDARLPVASASKLISALVTQRAIDAGLLDRDATTAVDALFANTHPTATVGYAPDAVLPYDFRYGYGAWLLCPGPVPTCPVIASPGAYGFTPWIDRDRGLVALLVMDSGTPGGATWAVPWSEVLRPQVAAALDAAAD